MGSTRPSATFAARRYFVAALAAADFAIRWCLS